MKAGLLRDILPQRSTTDLIAPKDFEKVGEGDSQLDSKSRHWEVHQATAPDGSRLSVLVISGSDTTCVHLGAMQTLDLGASDAKLNVPLIEDFIRGPASQFLAESPDATHYFVQSRVANWTAGLSGLKKQIQTARRFYLLGIMPEQLELEDAKSLLSLDR